MPGISCACPLPVTSSVDIPGSLLAQVLIRKHKRKTSRSSCLNLCVEMLGRKYLDEIVNRGNNELDIKMLDVQRVTKDGSRHK